jgi:hypothetical protein
MELLLGGGCILPINEKPVLWVFKASYDVRPMDVSVKKNPGFFMDLFQISLRRFFVLYMDFVRRSVVKVGGMERFFFEYIEREES